jgi:hypothetical protein
MNPGLTQDMQQQLVEKKIKASLGSRDDQSSP